MNDNSPVERRVLVCFKKNISRELIENFLAGINELKTATPGLIRFDLEEFLPVRSEERLNAAVANVTFPDLMTVWTFKNQEALESFLESDHHLRVAKEKFKPAVEHRVVFNSRLLQVNKKSQATSLASIA